MTLDEDVEKLTERLKNITNLINNKLIRNEKMLLLWQNC
jgi:hypothetical protein